MKIIASVLCVGMFLLSGCAGLRPERGVTPENVFYSTGLPRLKVQVDKSFEYLGDISQQKGTYQPGIPHGFSNPDAKMRTYIFLSKESRRYVAIDIMRAPGEAEWVTPKPAGWMVNTVNKSGPGAKFLASNGLAVLDYVLIYSDNFNADNGMTRVYVYYAEEISFSRYGAFRGAKYEELSKESQAILDDFIKRAKAAYTILEGKP